MSSLKPALSGIALSLCTVAAYAQAPVRSSVEREVPAAAVESPSASPVNSLDEWSIHFQTTTTTQTHFGFEAPYSGPLSLNSHFEIPSSLTATAFLGHKLWQNAAVFANPEESLGSGLSGTHGVAGFPNGEVYRVDANNGSKLTLSRFFVQQDFNLSGDTEKLEDDVNQFAAVKSTQRITLVLGKFSLNDYFDENSYSHDPRSQFMNWALMDNGAWDYAADTRGYTWGLMAELHLKDWSLRFGLAQVPNVANGPDLEGDLLDAHAENLEVEYRYQLQSRPGKIRVLGFMNQAKMGSYEESLALANPTPDITQTRKYRTKYGFGLNIEQEISQDVGMFSRLGWNDGASETWAFTEIDRSLSLGISLKGRSWKRADDVFGLAVLLNGLSSAHQDYLKAGGLGFIIGDGRLNYSPEEIIETYYACQISKPIAVTLDVQGVNHPAYNSDRGPLAIYGLRLHYEI